MNCIISKETNGRIKKIIDDSDVDNSLSFLFGIASSFTGKWWYPFQKTTEAIFHSIPQRNVTMVSQTGAIGWMFHETEEWSCLGIPYSHKHIFYILLPKENDGLEELIRDFEWSVIDKCTKAKDFDNF